ncbi:S8 family peptidase [Rhodopirellula baltica]|uniref:S8 family peptidase n=1 Tax=Rhodopirellula baltica TaxID=265606 RepID=UPI00056BDEBE|nr:S8 family peptidase [Rhodopirellula baltica]
MASLPHLFPRGTVKREDYVYPREVKGSRAFNGPPRDRIPHSKDLIRQIKSIEAAGEEVNDKQNVDRTDAIRGKVLEFSGAVGFDLKSDSLGYRTSRIELRSVRRDEDGRIHATVFVPDGQMGFFIKRCEQYATELGSGKKPRPRHQDLIEGISQIRLASLKSFWSDAGSFPAEEDIEYWWELWLSSENEPEVASLFQADARSLGITVATEKLRFPERMVVLARASANQLKSIPNLFEHLAEVRLAKLLSSELLELPAVDQAEYIDEALERITVAVPASPSVCHLDTGVNRAHPLLQQSIDENHVLTVNPSWSASDRVGHGTEMAGIALYGCLTEVLNQTHVISLSHRIESVKIMGLGTTSDPALWGAMTQQAANRIAIASPENNCRSFCLTVTAQARDEGYPSSWSAAIDQSAAAMDEESSHRLFIISAGNLSIEQRREYPDRNFVEGIEDPGQSWNAITVGGYTEKQSIRQSGLEEWERLAVGGSLSPASRTSRIWEDKSWPIKPEIVMEAGNMLRNPTTGDADFADDLSLLTTRLDHNGSLLTTTGDTSAAAALASRFAARLWAEYPRLWPETIRALIVHSATWTEAMHQMVQGTSRETLLRTFGYGVPNFDSASRSANHSATMIIESQIQPFVKTTARVKTKDMHFHRLPWPSEVLADLGESEVRLKITLSYFIQPSPGRRGWTKKHRYQSHGLRFDVKRPADTDEEFRKRLTASAREEDEGYQSDRDDRKWVMGRNLRCKGSVHSDTWIGTAADLAAANLVAVVPVTGWWKERPHLGYHDSETRYALIISIETDDVQTDLYTPIENAIAISTII